MTPKMVILRLIARTGGNYTLITSEYYAAEIKQLWTEWQESSTTRDNNQLLRVEGMGDNWARTPVDVVVEMESIEGLTITQMETPT